MKRSRLFVILIVTWMLTSCEWPKWVGKYKSRNCTFLEYVELHPDKTADIKYWSAPFAVNRPLKINGNKFTIEQFVFELKPDGLHEIAGYDPDCVLKKTR